MAVVRPVTFTTGFLILSKAGAKTDGSKAISLELGTLGTITILGTIKWKLRRLEKAVSIGRSAPVRQHVDTFRSQVLTLSTLRI